MKTLRHACIIEWGNARINASSLKIHSNSKEGYWNTIYLNTLHCTLQSATHTYTVLHWGVAIVNAESTLQTLQNALGKAPVPINNRACNILISIVNETYVSTREKETCGLWDLHRYVHKIDWNTLVGFRCDFSSKSLHQCKCMWMIKEKILVPCEKSGSRIAWKRRIATEFGNIIEEIYLSKTRHTCS